MAEELFKGLTMRQSVHLENWPAAGQVNGIILNEMAQVREVITQGLAQRAGAGIKARQPLKAVKAWTGAELKPELLEIIKEELNVKQVDHQVSKEAEVKAEMDLEITDELKQEGTARELIRFIQNARKNAGLNVDDRINLSVEADSHEVQAAFDKFKDEIYHETLATGELKSDAQHSEEVKLDGQAAQINLSKAN
jgi:isoleucyl-tRNA synthetase